MTRRLQESVPFLSSGAMRLLRGVSFVCFLIIAISALVACASNSETKVRLVREKAAVSPVIAVEVVDTPASRSQGLMYRKELAPDRGMLFVFPSAEDRSFWMKNTYLELDILFFDQDRILLNVVHRAAPLTQTPRKSSSPAQFALEIKGGLARQWGVQAGDRLEILGQQ